MLFIEISLGLLPLLAVISAAFSLGFILRSSQLRYSRKKVLDLEKEMLDNHAEILELQKERAELLRHMKESRIPVITMKTSKDDMEKLEQNRRVN